MSKDFIHHLACKCGGEFEKFIECETLVFEGIVYFFFFQMQLIVGNLV